MLKTRRNQSWSSISSIILISFLLALCVNSQRSDYDSFYGYPKLSDILDSSIYDDDPSFEREPHMESPITRDILATLFTDYKLRNKDFRSPVKRISKAAYTEMSGRFDWLKKSPKSIVVGSIAAVTLFMGIVLAVGIVARASIKNDQSDEEGTDVETDGDFTVYECAGVQPSNDVEVKNPLFAGAENSSDDGSPLGDDELLNTSQHSSLDNDEKTFVEKKE